MYYSPKQSIRGQNLYLVWDFTILNCNSYTVSDQFDQLAAEYFDTKYPGEFEFQQLINLFCQRQKNNILFECKIETDMFFNQNILFEELDLDFIFNGKI